MINITKTEAKMIQYIETLGGLSQWIRREMLDWDKATLKALVKKGFVLTHAHKGVSRKSFRQFDAANYNII